ncbi:hypothetical protein SAMN05421759_101417 [Roseivivax lentus]|uniref:Uncharacterized protein n=1 Tax=Roseivivax lentus TaxID=633194 RepID=A0A1N7K2T7_9RHOB|nr:DUF6478 family protein [Roseivivax lentus]SIS55915.1 hypothetical protein SAMN05421759_101417 [Roseivivax lentus]
MATGQMAERQSFLDGLIQRAALRRLKRAAQSAPEADLRALRRQRAQARQLKQQIDELLHVADNRLALPLIGNQSFPRPHDADWAWRPELWTGPLPVKGISSVQSKSMLGREATLFHDCAQSELTLRQLRNTREADLAPFGLRLDVFRFTGSYLSLAIDLPEEAARGLKRRHLVRLETIVEMEKPIEIFARLNIRHGPNTEQLVREMPLHQDDVMIEFDLAYTKLNEKRVEKLWLDIIFEGPQMNQVTLRDLTFSRRPRAEL